MEESYVYRPITTEKEARAFLNQWSKYIGTDNYRVLYDAVVGLEDFLYLDVAPFLKACLKSSDGIVQIAALDALRQKIEKSSEPVELDVLWEILQNSTSNIVLRGAVLIALGSIARIHNLPDVLNLLLSIVNDRKQDNELRLNAYKGLIRLLQKSFQDPKYFMVNINYSKSADDQIYWPWIAELEHQTNG